MRAVTLVAAATFLFAGTALADGPIATAPTTGPSAPEPTAAPPALPTTPPPPADGPQVAMGPCGPEKVKANGTLETKPHGEVDAGVGSNGYRYVGGSVCQPVGQDGVVAVSVSETQYGGARGRR